MSRNVYLHNAIRIFQELELPCDIATRSFSGKQLSKINKDTLSEEIEKSGGNSNSLDDIPVLTLDALEVNNVILMLDFNPVIYNRYRRSILNNTFYDGFKVYHVDRVKTFCSRNEKDALKSGLISGVWTNEVAETIFGKSTEPGEFYANGSSGWKLLSMQYLIRDMILNQNEQDKYIVLSPYESIMSGGKLNNLEKLLGSNNVQNKEILMKFLGRVVKA